MTADGSKLRDDSREAKVVERQAQHLVRFLQQGHNRANELIEIFSRLKKEIALGYALDMNDTVFYRLNSMPNSDFPQRCDFGPCESEFEQIV
jgi:hypothetical protein